MNLHSPGSRIGIERLSFLYEGRNQRTSDKFLPLFRFPKSFDMTSGDILGPNTTDFKTLLRDLSHCHFCYLSILGSHSSDLQIILPFSLSTYLALREVASPLVVGIPSYPALKS